MSADKPKGNVFAESTAELEKHLGVVRKRIAALEKELVAEAHVETMVEARYVFSVMVNDGYVLTLRDKRNELEFLLRRKKDITSDIAHFDSEVAAAARTRREAAEAIE